MGAWGYGIRQDDFDCDVIGVVEDLMKSGNTLGDKELVPSATRNDRDSMPCEEGGLDRLPQISGTGATQR